MQIQMLTKKWLNQVVNMDKEGQKWNDKNFTDFFIKDKGLGFIIQQNNKVFGFACLQIKKNILCTTRFFIDKKYRRKKIGTELYNFIINNKKDEYKEIFKNKKIFAVNEKDNESLKFFSSKNLKSKLVKNLYKNSVDGIIFFDDDEIFSS